MIVFEENHGKQKKNIMKSPSEKLFFPHFVQDQMFFYLTTQFIFIFNLLGFLKNDHENVYKNSKNGTRGFSL